MPVEKSSMQKPDPFVMNKYIVINVVSDFLTEKGYVCKPRSESVKHVDLIAVKDHQTVYVEARGNQAKKHTDQVFDTSQLRIHLSEQIESIMRLIQEEKKSSIYIAANPDVPRIRQLVGKVQRGMNLLNIVRFWVQPDGLVIVESSDEARFL